MLSPITPNRIIVPRYNTNKKSQFVNKSPNLKSDAFVKSASISFTSAPANIDIVGCLDYIRYVKTCFNMPEDLWISNVKKTFKRNLQDARIWNEPQQLPGAYYEDTKEPAYYNAKDPMERVPAAFLSLGLSELALALKKAEVNKDVNKYVSLMQYIMRELKKIDAHEKIVRQIKHQDDTQVKILAEAAKEKVKVRELYPKFLDLIQNQKEGAKVDMPNSIMLANPDEQVNLELIEWVSKNANARFLSMDASDPLDEVLESCEESYNETKDWNIIYIRDFDKVLNPKLTDPSIIDSVKDLMSAAASDYHSTLIFSAPHPEELDPIAIESHRVKIIDTSSIKSGAPSLEYEARERILNRPNYTSEYPLAAINDLLVLAHAKPSQILGVLSSHEAYLKALDFIRENLHDPEIKVEKIIEETRPKLWYLRDFTFTDGPYEAKKREEGIFQEYLNDYWP